MKKLIFSVAALMAVCTLSAQKVTILSGSADFMKEADALASFEVDLSDCVVVDFGTGGKIRKEKGTLEEYLEAGNKDKEKYIHPKGCSNYDAAALTFNRANKKGMHLLVGSSVRESYRMMPSKKSNKLYKQGARWEDANVKYQITFHVDTVDMGITLGLGGSMIPGADGGARATCWGEVIEIASNKSVCEFNLGRFYGSGYPDEAMRFFNAIYAAIASQFPKLAKVKK